MRLARSTRSLRPALAVVAVLVAGSVLAGCRSGSALHRRYDNFRAYYNAYYNASQKLDEGERALLNDNTPVDRGLLVELFPSGAGAGGRSAVFDSAIEKSAELLRQRPGSKWADDALLVIGKAYFYERNFVGAEQKFRETITAAGISEDRRLADEARFWLGRTMAAADRYDEGVLVLRDALELPDGDTYWTARMHLALGELYARAGRWDAATVDLRAGIEGVRDADLAARAALLLGQVEEAAGRYDAAAEAYEAALDRRPSYEVAFAAEVNRGLVLGLDAGRTDDALSLLRAMGRDDKNYARRAEVALAQARVLAAAGEADEARERYRDVLYDVGLAGQAIRGEAHFRLAEFYRDVAGDYVTAAAHFDTAATAISAPALSQQPPSRAAILGADGVATTYETVARTSLRIAAVDSLLALGALDPEAFAVRIAEIESVRRAEWVQQRREADAMRTAQDFGGTGLGGTTFGGSGTSQPGALQGVTTPGAGGSAAAAAASDVANGFLGFRDPRTVQAGLLAFQRIFGDRPLVPNWRRRAAVQGGGTANAVGVGSSQQDFAPEFDGLAGPPPLDLSDIPRTPAAVAELVSERAELRYELANTFFLALARPDRAGVLYRQILDETPDAPVAARARYALAELESGEGRTEVAAPLYRDVAAADSLGALGQAARARLEGREPTAAVVVPDTRSDDAFTAARRFWDDGDPYRAAVALVALGDADPDDAGAPRAFFAAALAYADWAKADSAALAAALPAELIPAAFDGAAPRDSTEDVPEDVPEDAQEDIPATTDEVSDDLSFGEQPLQTRGSRRDRSAPLPVLPQPARQPPMPVGAPADSAAVGTDDMPRFGDVPASLPDSTQGLAADAPVDVPLDAVPAPSDSLAEALAAVALPVGAETLGRVDTLAAGAFDSLAVPAVSEMTLHGYLVALAARYRETPYAARARAMAAALQPGESQPAEEASEISSVEPALAEGAAPVPSVVFEGLRGSTPISLDAGGVSWLTGPFETLAEAQAHVASYGDPTLRTAIASSEGGYTVLLGLFGTPMEAAASFEAKKQALFVGATPGSVEGLTLVDPVTGLAPARSLPSPDSGGPPGDGSERP